MPHHSARKFQAFCIVVLFVAILGAAMNAWAATNWNEKVLHDFNHLVRDGLYPSSVLASDAAGNLYGTTGSGGTYNDGVVFELSPAAGGWTESVLYSFCSRAGCGDGNGPSGGLIFDATGNLYGTTQAGGTSYFYGTVFELTPANPCPTCRPR